MAVRKYKPTSNGRRNMSVLTFDEITTDTPEKSLGRAAAARRGFWEGILGENRRNRMTFGRNRGILSIGNIWI